MIDSPDVTLAPKAAELLTLAIHELATNAVKYGALSVPNGKVTVRWSTFEKRCGLWLASDWIEEGAPARPSPVSNGTRRRVFGSELIEDRIPTRTRDEGMALPARVEATQHQTKSPVFRSMAVSRGMSREKFHHFVTL